MSPEYVKLYHSGELQKRKTAAYEILESCELCPRSCRVNRLAGELGICKTGGLPKISSYNPHFGEEAPLVGRHGSGTIFAANCNLGCVFCQNYDISHLGHGKEISTGSLAEIMLELQEYGCHNINFVTPTHIVPFILAALTRAVEAGFNLPIVYNCSGYESIASLKLLEGVVDIYMPDFKFAATESAEKYAHAPDYFEVACTAVKEMHRQVGDLAVDEQGIAQRGLLVRHLVMPEALAETEKVVKFLADEISPNTYVNIMAQYRPCGKAEHYPELRRSLSYEEYKSAVKIADQAGLKRLDQR